MPSLTKHRTVPDGFVEPADIPTGWVLRVSQILDPVTPERWKRLRQTREHGSEGVSGGSAHAAIMNSYRT